MVHISGKENSESMIIRTTKIGHIIFKFHYLCKNAYLSHSVILYNIYNNFVFAPHSNCFVPASNILEVPTRLIRA